MLKKMNKKHIAAVFFIGYLALLVFVTLLTHNYYTYGKSSNLILFSSIRLMLRSGDSMLIMKNIGGNVMLFLPLGFLLPMLIQVKRRLVIRQLILGFCISLFIELCQYFFAERIFDIDDVLLNTIGAMIGWGCYVLIRFCRHKLIVFYTK
ncbi:VanZ family protein [Sporolactobacillus shoreicorticis]|uniref:VanZ family protein n=1 Tax=Sporolactobacillus shoreicorticis TaxID=1923877 RepID=A0ABW5S444_9BACL|nr:VanZ family protein [Sporolactobacillus shoreicorticis]MCO7125805.1 VanZ family protein [Sporolactobacillus shoreicorticis]